MLDLFLCFWYANMMNKDVVYCYFLQEQGGETIIFSTPVLLSKTKLISKFYDIAYPQAQKLLKTEYIKVLTALKIKKTAITILPGYSGLLVWDSLNRTESWSRVILKCAGF